MAETILICTEDTSPGQLWQFDDLGSFSLFSPQPPWTGANGKSRVVWGSPDDFIIVEDFTTGDMFHYDPGTGLWTTKTAGFSTSQPLSSLHGYSANDVWASHCCLTAENTQGWNGTAWAAKGGLNLQHRVFGISANDAWSTYSSTFAGPYRWNGSIWLNQFPAIEAAVGYNVRQNTESIHAYDASNVFFGMRTVSSAAPTPGGFDLGGRVYRYNGTTFVDMGGYIGTGQAFNMFVQNIFSSSPTDVWIEGYTIDISQPPGSQNRHFICKWAGGTTWTLQTSLGLGVVNFSRYFGNFRRVTLWGKTDGQTLVYGYTDNSLNGWYIYTLDGGTTWSAPQASPGGAFAGIGTAGTTPAAVIITSVETDGGIDGAGTDVVTTVGGHLITMAGTFPRAPVQVFLGPAGDETDPPCYGLEGNAYQPLSDDGTTLLCVSPPLEKGAAALTVRYAGTNYAAGMIAVVERNWPGKYFRTRALYPPWQGVGKRRLALEPLE